jgi:hypothetical protein
VGDAALGFGERLVVCRPAPDHSRNAAHP